MNEAIGGSSLFTLVIFLVSATLLLLIGALTYSKAYKVKNRIVNIIEVCEESSDTDATTSCNPSIDQGYVNLKKEINADMASIGYNITSGNPISGCSIGAIYNNNEATSYDICVYKEILNDGTYYYKIVSFAHLNVPVIGNFIHFPVTGETKIYGKNYDY